MPKNHATQKNTGSRFPGRGIATISALAGKEGANSMLQFHLNAGMNVGLTGAQVRSLMSVIESRVGMKEAKMPMRYCEAVFG